MRLQLRRQNDVRTDRVALHSTQACCTRSSLHDLRALTLCCRAEYTVVLAWPWPPMTEVVSLRSLIHSRPRSYSTDCVQYLDLH